MRIVEHSHHCHRPRNSLTSESLVRIGMYGTLPFILATGNTSAARTHVFAISGL